MEVCDGRPADRHRHLPLHRHRRLPAGDYYGTPVNGCARLRAMAYGGRTLLSQATYDLVGDHSLPGLGPDHRFGPRGRDDCHTLGGRETGWQPLVASLRAYLRTKQLLLVLETSSKW